MDPAELRRRNLLDPAVFPHTTPPGARYDVGDYDLPLREALRLAGYDELRAEQARRRESGDPVQLGIGICVYVEITAGGGGSEFGSVTVHADGSATISAGTSGHGQGHPTAFAMLASDRLGIPMDRFTFVQSDTALVPRGSGTGGSRSLQLGGNAVLVAADDVLEQAKRQAAALLEAAEDDVELTEDGEFGVAGVPSVTVTWAQVAAAAAADSGEELHAGLDFRQEGATFPFGAHVSVVEVDTETGRVTPRRHVAVDDCGRILNPLLVTGQQHGGLAQGIAQALYEEVLFDDEGQPLTATLADYRMPTAADLFTFETANTETPTPLNPLGAKGIGESATIGSTPAVQNAVVDALSPSGCGTSTCPARPSGCGGPSPQARAGAPGGRRGGSRPRCSRPAGARRWRRGRRRDLTRPPGPGPGRSPPRRGSAVADPHPLSGIHTCCNGCGHRTAGVVPQRRAGGAFPDGGVPVAVPAERVSRSVDGVARTGEFGRSTGRDAR
jgi:carbon-monoxide dehydrogenase large subunit